MGWCVVDFSCLLSFSLVCTCLDSYLPTYLPMEDKDDTPLPLFPLRKRKMKEEEYIPGNTCLSCWVPMLLPFLAHVKPTPLPPIDTHSLILETPVLRILSPFRMYPWLHTQPEKKTRRIILPSISRPQGSGISMILSCLRIMFKG